jgi:hypothetical protein
MVTNVQDYLATIEERRRLEGMLEQGRKEFSGYGLELFERGLRKKIAKLTDAIAQQDAQSPHNVDACEILRSFTCDVAGRYIFDPSSIANFSNCVVINCNVQMLQGPISLYRGVRLSPLLVHQTREQFDILGSSYMPRPSGLTTETRAGLTPCFSA